MSGLTDNFDTLRSALREARGKYPPTSYPHAGRFHTGEHT